MLYGYMRPYGDDQECKKQREELAKHNCSIIYTEPHSLPSYKVELNHLLLKLKRNDKVVATKFFSIADSTKDLASFLKQLQQKGAFVFFTQENIDTSKETGKYLYDFLESMVILQSDIISAKTKKGIFEAKQKGKLTGRPRKQKFMIQRAIDMYHSNRYTLLQIREETGISKSSLYRYLHEK